ncbi:hypothetical protein OAG38_05800 [Akkermansiaceae bacterium]|nr:hypothetical protein [Akkermansiaceae bacterium]MDB4763235.1 hypothetical protein [Akkermansiaceae bacterium]
MKRLILSIIALAVSVSPLTAKTGFLVPKKENVVTNLTNDRHEAQYLSEIIEVAAGEEFKPLIALGSGSSYGRELDVFPVLEVWPSDADPYGVRDGRNSYLFTEGEIVSLHSNNLPNNPPSRSFRGPVKVVIRLGFDIRQSGDTANDGIALTWNDPNKSGFIQYRISKLESVSKGQEPQFGILEPKRENVVTNLTSNYYTAQYLSEIIELKEGETFRSLSNIGYGATFGRIAFSTNMEFWPVDEDPYAALNFSDNKNAYLYSAETGSSDFSINGPIKIVMRFGYRVNQQQEGNDSNIEYAWNQRQHTGYCSYQITSSEAPPISESLLQDSEFVSSIASSDSFRATLVSAIAQDAEALESMRQALDIAAAELAVAENSAAVSANAQNIQDIATSVTTIATSVQDNATGIATNGTAIAGNGTSIQDIATGVAAIGTSVQDNATGITANGTGITSNASSIATNATTIAGNATSTETNSGAITQINLTLQANQNERGRNALEIGQNQLRFQALENQIGSLGSDAAFIQKLGDEFATKADLMTAISEGKTQGINAVTSDPNNWNIFTADQIQEMAVGDLVLTREENGDFVLNYEIQQSDNAKDWTTYSAQAETITGLPANKAFVRIRTR